MGFLNSAYRSFPNSQFLHVLTVHTDHVESGDQAVFRHLTSRRLEVRRYYTGIWYYTRIRVRSRTSENSWNNYGGIP